MQQGKHLLSGYPLISMESEEETKYLNACTIFALSMIVFNLCAIPYIVLRFFGPKDLHFANTFYFAHDFSQYTAAMIEGWSHSGWLITDHQSTEPQKPVFMYTFYVLLGKLAGLLHISYLNIFYGTEWIGRMLICVSTYLFVSVFIPTFKYKVIAFCLALGTLGISILFVHIQPSLTIPINDSFSVLFSAPHTMFGLGLTLLSVPIYLKSITNRNWLSPLSILLVTLSIIYPFNLPILASILCLHSLALRRFQTVILISLSVIPALLYNLVTFTFDPFWSGTYSAQNTIPSQSPWLLPLEYGLLLILAPFAYPIVLKLPYNIRLLLVLWVGLDFLGMYAPVTYQNRFSLGIQEGLAVFASMSIFRLNAIMRLHNWKQYTINSINIIGTIAAFSTSIFVYGTLIYSIINNYPIPIYMMTNNEYQAAAQISRIAGPDDIILASTNFSNPLSGMIYGRTYQGHTVATYHSQEKDALVRLFYSGETTQQQRNTILDATQSTIVVYGPMEKSLNENPQEPVDLTQQPNLYLFYDKNGIQLFSVQHTTITEY